MESQGSQNSDSRTEDEIQLVAFRIAREEYALPIVKVQEIIKFNQITSVPHTKPYIDGIINLRGSVIPVIDLRTRFGIERKSDLEQRRIVVVHIKGKTNGFVVDSVTEVLRVRKSQIEATPASLSGDNDASFVEGIGKLNDGKRIIILINPDLILSNDDGASLRNLVKDAEQIEKSTAAA